MEYLEVIELLENRLNSLENGKSHRVACLSTMPTNSQEFPASRNVIIREYDPSNSSLLVYTHTLSEKVAQITENPNATIVWYDPVEMVQIQFYCFGRIELNQDRVLAHQKDLRENALKDYIGPKPGSILSKRPFQNEDLKFCLLHFEIEEMVVLKIGNISHQKFRFRGFPHQLERTELVP